jgi:hypothetical protein
MKQDSNILLILLIILSLLTFTRTQVYILFSNRFINLGKIAGLDIDDIFKKTMIVFAIVRFLLANIILYTRKFQNDTLSYVLVYLIFSSLQRFYYDYLIEHNSESKIKYYLKDFQPVNTFLILASSLYIMKYVLF